MNVVFRADASVSIGSGHVMRCLTLADALALRGARCHFVCGAATGPLMDLIRASGHAVTSIAGAAAESDDLAQCRAALAGLRPEWIVVDHYQLGEAWEAGMKNDGGRPLLLALDDLGRAHYCDVLLDQNFDSPMHGRYRRLVPVGAQLLLGPHFALVRPEFAAARPRSLGRRDGTLARFLVTLGGTDPDNETCKVLAGLGSSWRAGWAVDVVIGAANPHRRAVEEACERLPDARLHVQTQRMAELMSEADCAITAGGSTTWERCCLGLPALVVVVSDDQAPIAESVARVGAHVVVGRGLDLTAAEYANQIEKLNRTGLLAASAAAARLCDGAGAQRVADRLHAGVEP